MYSNNLYSGLPYGDANQEASTVVITPDVLSVTASWPPPVIAIDIIIAPDVLTATASVPPPVIAIDVLVTPDVLSVTASWPQPAVYTPVAIEKLRERPRAEPVYLAEVELKNSGPTLYFADRNITVFGQHYEDYILDVSGLALQIRSTPEGSMSLKFRNNRYLSCDHLIELGDTYPFEGATATLKECYLDDNGAPSEVIVVFKGTIDAPRDIDRMGFSCGLSPMEVSKDNQWKQDVIDTVSYPNAHEDLGEVEPVIYGEDVLVPALRVNWGGRTTLVAQINASQTTGIELSDSSRIESSGTVVIDDERIGYTGISSNVLTGITRGIGGTTATAHRAGADVWQDMAYYDSLLAGHELHSVGDIFAEIRGRLWRVTSGVSAVLSGGKHLLRATEQIKVKAVEDDIAVNDSIGINDGIGVQDNIGGSITAEKKTWQGGTPGAGFVLNSVGDKATFATFPSASGSPNLFECDLQYNYVLSYSVLSRLVVKAYPTGYPGDSQVVLDINTSTGFATSFTTFKCTTHATSVTFECTQLSGTNASVTIYPLRADRTYQTIGTFGKSGAAYRSGSVTKTGSATKSGDVIATHTVERFHAVVSGHKDPDGNYGGTGSLIERPDYVIKNFLVKQMGFPLADIDNTSFNNAGSNFSTAGYKFAFRIDGKVRPSEFLRRMARECRSIIIYRAGKWHLDYLPDAAPAAVRKIASGDLAGEFSKFEFSKTPMDELSNDLTARSRRNYSRLGMDSAWDATAKCSDSASQVKYGLYPGDLDFYLIRDSAMAADVLGHMLTELKTPRLTVEFPIFYEHFDLEPGDTIEIDNPLYNNRKFLIEAIRRLDKFRAEVRAKEWWS